MGYESKLYIVEKSKALRGNEKRYASVVAMFDMAKMGSIVNVFEKKTDCYIYADDGDTMILEDKYGDELTEATVEDVIEVLEKAIGNGVMYRRLYPLLSALTVIKEQQDEGTWEDVVVLHYGY